ncbi:MAG TPA: alpha/beta fold hydrolase [Tepidisphaeraceae bacterium]|nr:alpha/beta fold hydrolase [Tepidisphaeraceae bacterium]
MPRPTVILHHGLLGYDVLQVGPFRHAYWRGIDRAITDDGYPLIVTRAAPTGGVARRARELKESMLTQLDRLGDRGRRVILVGHSMGGLDARYAVARLGLADRVAAVVTVCTPNRGSPVADFVVQHLNDRIAVLRLLGKLGLEVGAATDLTTRNCEAMNLAAPDAAGVAYFSVGATRPWYQMPPWAMATCKLIEAAEGANDGLVSVASSHWGTDLGVWRADHWHSINRRVRPEFGPDPTGPIAPYWVRMLRAVEARLADARSASVPVGGEATSRAF